MKSLNLSRSLLAFACLTFIVSCNSKNQNSEITIIGEDSANLHALRSLAQPYQQKNGLTINFSAHDFDVAGLKSNQDLVNQTGLYDILMQYNFSLSSNVRNNYVYNLSELRSMVDTTKLDFEKDIFENAWKETSVYYDPEVNDSNAEMKVGYPFAANTMLLVYNKELFENAQNKARYKALYNEELLPPSTWESFRQIAAFFTDPKKDTYGICLQGAGKDFLYYEFTHILFGMGGRVFDKKYGWQESERLPLEIDSDKAIKIAEFYKSLKPYNAGTYVDVTADKQIKYLKNGNVAMGIVWSDYLYGLCYGEGKVADKRFGYAPSPGKVSPLGGGCFFVNKQSKNPKAAMEYIVAMLQKPAQIELAKHGASAVLKSVYDDQEVQKIPYADALKRSLERGVYMFEAGIESDIISNCIATNVLKLYSGELTPAQAMKNAKKDIETRRQNVYQGLK